MLTALALGWNFLFAQSGSTHLSADDVVIATVAKGSLRKDIRATGTLVPADLRWIESRVDGRVENTQLEAGQTVSQNDLIMELSNPTLRRNVDAARIDLQVLEAETTVLEKRLVRDVLAQEAVVADVLAQFQNASFRKEANEELAQTKAISKLELNEARLLETQLKTRLIIEKERLQHLKDLNAAEIRANNARINRARSQLQLQEELMDSLNVRAGIDGVLQEIPVEVGQQIAVGTLLARVAKEDSLLAELRVQESQAKDVNVGQKTAITANGQSVEGTVTRIDPAVVNGVVVVDVRFEGQMFPGARPDMRVEGSIEVGALFDILLLPRPVFSRENNRAAIFRLDENNRAHKVQVSYGMGSLEFIQIVGGLREGDRVLISDMTAFADRETLALGK